MAAVVRITFAFVIIFGMCMWICVYQQFSVCVYHSKLNQKRTVNKFIVEDVRNEGNISTKFNNLHDHSQRDKQLGETPEIVKNVTSKNKTTIEAGSFKLLLITRTTATNLSIEGNSGRTRPRATDVSIKGHSGWTHPPATNVSTEGNSGWTGSHARNVSIEGNPGWTQSLATNVSIEGQRPGPRATNITTEENPGWTQSRATNVSIEGHSGWTRARATNVSTEGNSGWTRSHARNVSVEGNPGWTQSLATNVSIEGRWTRPRATNVSVKGTGSPFASNVPIKGKSEYPVFVKNRLFYNKTAIKQEFRYIHSNSDLCTRNQESKNDSVFLLVMVLTSPGEVARRSAIRQTWGNITKISGHQIATIFLLANSTNAKREQLTEKENDMFHDICKKDFIDSYDNLTLKVMMGFEWVNSFCNKSKFVLKIDSDMTPNLRNLVNFLANSPKSFFFNGHMMKERPVVRNRSGYGSKWYVSREEYPHVTYPPYELGAAYVLSTDLIRQAVSVVPHVPLFRFEDVYVGMLMKTLGVHTSSDSRYIFNGSPTKPTRDGFCSFSKAFTINLPQELNRFWELWNDFDEAQCE